jgi:NhaP-type Na+/H+ or K+/H+ antiporter
VTDYDYDYDSSSYNNNNFDVDDYFETDDDYSYTGHECCQALMSLHLDYCASNPILSNFNLLVAAAILLVCECAKALVSRLQIHFLTEAAVCILVGTAFGFLVHYVLPFTNVDDTSFDNALFLTVLLPPIIFEAALSVSKSELKRRRGAILMFSVFGTIITTFSTGLLVHYMSKASPWTTTFPMLDSLTFGALISSIDPVAILSVLTSLHLDQKDTIFILVFGESLLNDGIAITLFETLGGRFDGKTNDGTTSVDEILEAVATFFISMFGSIAIGVGCGALAWGYFSLLDTRLSPVMEVGSFFLWALIPYYIADAINMSGIVTIVAVGFFMDIYIAGPKGSGSGGAGRKKNDNYNYDHDYTEHDHNSSPHTLPEYSDMELRYAHTKSFDHSVAAPFISTGERLHLSATADRHVRFVAHLTSQLAENAIFVYLGFFLFSSNYDWDPTLITIAITSCVLSRALMVVVVSALVHQIYKCRGRAGENNSNISKTAVAIRNPRTQAVLVLAGLRGAVSLALAENIPIYNQGTGEGCEFKQVMKGMTSACIIFTTFVFGGSAYYILPHLGITPDPSTNTPRNGGIMVIEAPALLRPPSEHPPPAVSDENLYVESYVPPPENRLV